MIFCCFATPRSGHHSMTYWLAHQHKDAPTDTICHQSCNTVKIEVPNYKMLWLNNLDNIRPSINGNWDRIFLVYERYLITEVTTCDSTNILMLRDYKNNLASILQSSSHTPKFIKWFANLWINSAKNILNNKGYFLNFNRYHCEVNYRRQVCEDLGLYFSDIGIDYITPFGDGSSFTKQRVLDKGRLNSRYVKLRPQHGFQPAMRLPESQQALKLSNILFGEV